MNEKLTAAAEKYERRIKMGFPPGELKAELLAEEYTEEEAVFVIEKIKELTAKKSVNRSKEFRIIIAVILILAGAYLLTSNKKTGWWLILSGLLDLIYHLGIKKKETH